MNQSEFEVNTCNRRQARENLGTRLVSVLFLIGWESGASFANQSQSGLKENKAFVKPLCNRLPHNVSETNSRIYFYKRRDTYFSAFHAVLTQWTSISLIRGRRLVVQALFRSKCRDDILSKINTAIELCCTGKNSVVHHTTLFS